MSQDELYANLLAFGFTFADIRKMTGYQIRNIVQKALELKYGDAG